MVVTYQNKRVGFPVGRSNLVCEPWGDSFGRFDAKIRHWLRNVFHSIQQPLSSIVVVFKKAIRLKNEKKRKGENNRVCRIIYFRCLCVLTQHFWLCCSNEKSSLWPAFWNQAKTQTQMLKQLLIIMKTLLITSGEFVVLTANLLQQDNHWKVQNK